MAAGCRVPLVVIVGDGTDRLLAALAASTDARVADWLGSALPSVIVAYEASIEMLSGFRTDYPTADVVAVVDPSATEEVALAMFDAGAAVVCPRWQPDLLVAHVNALLRRRDWTAPRRV
jgi:DNA-binding NarL/FixJ family response regulator